MATKIRLKRMGARGNPHYRLVVMDSKRPRDGNTIEEIGYYCPTTEPPTIEVQVNRALHWLCTGAQPSDTVRSLLAERGVMEAFRSGVKPGQMPEEVTPVVTPEQATQSAAESSQLAAEQHEETPPEQDSVQ